MIVCTLIPSPRAVATSALSFKSTSAMLSGHGSLGNHRNNYEARGNINTSHEIAAFTSPQSKNISPESWHFTSVGTFTPESNALHPHCMECNTSPRDVHGELAQKVLSSLSNCTVDRRLCPVQNVEHHSVWNLKHAPETLPETVKTTCVSSGLFALCNRRATNITILPPASKPWREVVCVLTPTACMGCVSHPLNLYNFSEK